MNNIPSSEVRKMNSIEEASSLIRSIAEPCPAGDSVKAAISRACRRVGWSFSRARAVWYADVRIRLGAEELDDLRSKARVRREDRARDPYHVLFERIARLEDAIALTTRQSADADASDGAAG